MTYTTTKGGIQSKKKQVWNFPDMGSTYNLFFKVQASQATFFPLKMSKYFLPLKLKKFFAFLDKLELFLSFFFLTLYPSIMLLELSWLMFLNIWIDCDHIYIYTW